ncbi:NAD(P)/FAD-dependent oxidoreductase [Humitalea sp. 24SJ18S-53]|uniref:NAD(P)/FAD-dependent oxidoreductase n=1 Tax=Humitalea sp. 24SJ18S-53 TaxID=3422307 RepID=UPI003D677505
MSSGASLKRDLRTGTPVWIADPPRPAPPTPLEQDVRVDVALIGCGVSGALVADALLQAGRTVAAFDRRGVAQGSTAASTALLQFELDQPLTLLSRRIGAEKAVRAYWRSATAVAHLRGRIADLNLRCGFRERHTLYLPGNVLAAAGLREEAEARARVGLRSRFIDAETLRRLTAAPGTDPLETGIDRPGAIWSGGAGEVDPVALVRGLWRSATDRGATIHAPCDIVDIAPGATQVVLTTDAGRKVRAKHLVLATGYELSKLVRPKGYKVISTWAFATRPQPDRLWPSRCLIWEAADPYLYIRTTRDGRVLVGGEDADFSDEAKRDRQLPAKVKRIAKKLGALMPGLDTEPDFTWTGCFGDSATSMPAIGPVPGAPRCFAVLGFGGNGITFSAIAAQVIQRAILGLPDPDADLFALA